jgi:Leucine-rich repeat (LRR) protein
VTAIDPIIEHAIQLQLQRDPPFTDDDLATVEVLGVLHATDISDLRRLTGLEVLRLEGYGGQDLRPLAGLPIGTLAVEFSAVSDLAVVAELPGLSRLIASNNAITDIDVLTADDRRFRKLDLTGNPLSDHSYYDVIPELRGRTSELRVSGEREWRLTRRLHASGLPFDYYRDDEGHWLCRPGLDHTDYPDSDHLEIAPDELEAILDRDPADIPGLFATYDK